MVEIYQDLDTLFDQVMGFLALDVHHESDAAGVVLVPGVVQALLGWQAVPSRLERNCLGGLVRHLRLRLSLLRRRNVVKLAKALKLEPDDAIFH